MSVFIAILAQVDGANGLDWAHHLQTSDDTVCSIPGYRDRAARHRHITSCPLQAKRDRRDLPFGKARLDGLHA